MGSLVRQLLADGFCANGHCGGNQTSAPCEMARQAADIAVDTLEKEGYTIIKVIHTKRKPFPFDDSDK